MPSYLEPGHRDALGRAVEFVEAGFPQEARFVLEGLARGLDLEQTPHQLAYLLCAGLARRLAGEEGDVNLYLETFDVPHGELFALLKSCDPLFQSAYDLANAQLARLLSGHPRATLLDLGTGDGLQLVDLVQQLGRRGELPIRLTVIGVDPAPESLRKAERDLEQTARRHRCDLLFFALPRRVEDLSEADWDLIGRSPGPLVVNASFVLHHLNHTNARPDARDTLFARLYALRPLGLVACNYSADFNLPGLRERVRNAARFFGGMFCHLDGLPLGVHERRLLKFAFWGREALDVLGRSELGRSERFETPFSWLTRLERAGFEPALDLGTLREVAHSSVRVSANEGYLGLDGLLSVVVGLSDEPLRPAMARSPDQTALSRRVESLDVGRYLRTLIRVARANGMVHVRERDFVEGQALLAGIDPRSLWEPIEETEEWVNVPVSTGQAVLRDCIALAHVDGEYDANEQLAVRRVAARLGVDEARLCELEADAQHLVPPLLEGGPAWFREYWLLQGKKG